MNSKMRDKKAQISGRKMLFYAIFAFMAAITFLFTIHYVGSQRSEIAKPPFGVPDYLVSYRFLNSPDCFAYEDQESDRAYPWTIDLGKFNPKNLNNCYNTKDTKVKAYRFTLSFRDYKSTIATSNWEGFLKKAETKTVSVYNNDRLESTEAELFIEMQDVK